MLSIVTPPAVSPVTVKDCKLQLRIDDTYDDEYLQILIDAATEYVGGRDGVLGNKLLINQTWDYSTEKPESNGKLWLPFSPVSSIVSISYYDGDEVLQTAELTDFNLFSDEDFAYIEPKTSKVWPTIYSRPDGITIQFVAGFGAAASDIPRNITQAILLIVAHWYENRTAVSSATAKELPMSAEALINMSRKGWVA